MSFVFRQGPHGAVALYDLREDGGFRAAHEHHPPAAGADVVHALAVVVQIGGSGADVGAGATGAAKHVGIDEVGGHLGEP